MTRVGLVTPVRSLASDNCWPERPIGARIGVMLHFDGSRTDVGAEQWFRDPACKVSYNRLYLDNGEVLQITPTMEHAAWHAGECRTKNANRAYYGLAAATDPKTPVTEEQLAAIANDAAALFLLNGWKVTEVGRRIVGHEDEACFPDGRLGRKSDPTGPKKDRPILSTPEVRLRVRQLLGAVAVAA